MSIVAVVPETVQKIGEVEAKLTGSPELAEATNDSGVPYVWSPGFEKLMVWLGSWTTKLRG